MTIENGERIVRCGCNQRAQMASRSRCYLRLAWKTPLGWLKTASATLPEASI